MPGESKKMTNINLSSLPHKVITICWFDKSQAL